MAIASARRTRERLAQIGTDPGDDADTRERKRLLVLTALLILPVAIAWGAIYLGFGQPAGILPVIYVSVSVGSLLVFARTGGFRFLLFVQLLDILLAPTLGQMLTGGLCASASAPAPSWPASSAASGSCTTCGVMR